MLIAASEWIQELGRFCGVVGDAELLEICTETYFEISTKEEVCAASREDNPGNWIFELLGNEIDTAVRMNHALLALLEALYGIANDYYLAWYCFSAIEELPVDFSLYIKLLELGGIHSWKGRRVIVARI